MTIAHHEPRTWRDLTQADSRSAEAIPLFRDLVSAMFKRPRDPVASRLFWQLFKSRVWNVIGGVAASRQAAMGDAAVITTQDREDVFQHTMAFLVSGIRYQPIRNRYSEGTPPILTWLTNNQPGGRLVGFVSRTSVNYAKDLFGGMVALRLRAKEVTRVSSDVAEDDEESLVDLQPSPEPEIDFTEQPEMQAWIRQCVDELEEPGRSLLVGVDIQGATQSSIAAALGISEATASRAIRVARSELGRRLQDRNPELLTWFAQGAKYWPKGDGNA